MKAIILLSCIILSSGRRGGFSDRQEFREKREKCLEENSLTVEELRGARRGNETSENYFCFQRCMLVQKGVLGEDFQVVESLPRFRRLGDEGVECIKGVGRVEDCEDAQKIHECFRLARRRHQ